MDQRVIRFLTVVTVESCVLTLLGCGNEQRSVAERDIPTWSLKPLFTLGDSGSTELQRVTSVLWLGDNRLLVADAGARLVLVFDSLGRRLGTLGREGSGPGEYRTPESLALIGETIVVRDPGNARLDLFSTTGAWVGSVALPPISGPQIRLYRVPGREFYTVGVQTRDTTMAALTFIRYDVTGPRDTLLRRKRPATGDGVVMCRGSDKGIHFFATPWRSRYVEVPGPHNTILSANTGNFDVVQRGVGLTVVHFVGSSEPTFITDAEWDSATTAFRDYLSKDSRAQCNTQTLERPAHKPAIRSFFWSDDGSLWVERYTTTGRSYDVFDDRGKLVATAAAPEHIDEVEPHVSNGRLVVVAESPDGAHLVRAFEVVRPRPFRDR